MDMTLETARKEVRDALLPSEDNTETDDSIYADMHAPAMGALMLIEREEGLPAKVGDVIIEDFSTRDGEPQHGALCSYKHLSEVRATVFGIPCRVCDNDGLTVTYTAYHHISVSRGVTCEYCGTELHSDIH